MASAYFDTSVFLAILNGESAGEQIRELLRELRADRINVCTSIITIQEVSVADYLQGGGTVDRHAVIERLARVHGITRDIALQAAKLEAGIIKRLGAEPRETKRRVSQRRKFDCFHLATAIEMNCARVYTLDAGFQATKGYLELPRWLVVTDPSPRNPGLFSAANP